VDDSRKGPSHPTGLAQAKCRMTPGIAWPYRSVIGMSASRQPRGGAQIARSGAARNLVITTAIEHRTSHRRAGTLNCSVTLCGYVVRAPMN